MASDAKFPVSEAPPVASNAIRRKSDDEHGSCSGASVLEEEVKAQIVAGNDAFREKRYAEATLCYTRALVLDETTENPAPDVKRRCLGSTSPGGSEASSAAMTHTHHPQPLWMRARRNRGKAWWALDEYGLAYDDARSLLPPWLWGGPGGGSNELLRGDAKDQEALHELPSLSRLRQERFGTFRLLASPLCGNTV